jgi:hypothetical protein
MPHGVRMIASASGRCWKSSKKEIIVKMEKKFIIIPASSGMWVFLWGLVVFILIISAIPLASGDYKFQSGAGIVTVVILIGVIGLLGIFAYQSRNSVFTVTGRGLGIGPGIYSRMIPREKIIASGVKVINLNVEKEYQPKWRLNGAGLPGFSAGWFKLQNNEKALAFITDRTNVVYIPTTDNYSVLLSAQDADVMAQAIKQWK